MDRDWHFQTKSWSELEKTSLGARFKKCAPNVGRMFPFYPRKTAEKEEKIRKETKEDKLI